MFFWVSLAVFAIAALILLGQRISRRKPGGHNVPPHWAAPLPPPAADAPRVELTPEAVQFFRELAQRHDCAWDKFVLFVGVDPETGNKLDAKTHGEFDPAEYVRTRSDAPMPVYAFKSSAAQLDGLVLERAPAGIVFGGALRMAASEPGRVPLSREKLAELHREMEAEFGPGPAGGRAETPEEVGQYLNDGDSRAAVVVAIHPQLLVAAYTDELLCVVPMRFPRTFVTRYGLRIGSRLLAVNSYFQGKPVAPDLVAGEGAESRFRNFDSIIADFLTDDVERVHERKAEIDEAEWERAMTLGIEYIRRFPGRARDGRPGFNSVPAA